jgi:hypothetical protein
MIKVRPLIPLQATLLMLNEVLENGRKQAFDREPYTGFWECFGVGFMRLLPIESQI